VTDTPQVLLAHHLKALKLPTFLREYDKLARQCAREGVDHVRYLLRLAELELIDRERRMVERRVRQAKFPAVKSSENHPDDPISREWWRLAPREARIRSRRPSSPVSPVNAVCRGNPRIPHDL
jgi:hypothetical protein